MTNGEIEAFLWEELHSPQYLQTLFYSLRKTLRGIGFEDLLIRTRNHTSIDVSKLHCDLYEFLKGSADAVAALQTALEKCGNCRITISSYTGTGTLGEAHPTSLTFAEPPLLVFILGPESGFMARGRAMNAFQSSSNATPTTTWSADQKTVSWYTPYDAKYQLNTKDAVYQVLCFYQA